MTITPSVDVLGQRSACAIRATRLDATCAVVPGDNNVVVAAAIATATFTPDVKEGARIEPEDACGNISFTSTDPDVTKRYTLALELNTWDLALVELMTDASVQLGAVGSPWEGKIMGIERPGSQTPHKFGIALELWSKVAIGDGACGEAADVPPYWRHILPRVYLRTDDISFTNDVVTLKFAGWGASNPQWQEGPYGDWEAALPMSDDTPYGSYFASDIPTVGTGYGTVPETASA